MGVIPPSEVFLRVQPVLDFLTLASALLLHGRGGVEYLAFNLFNKSLFCFSCWYESILSHHESLVWLR